MPSIFDLEDGNWAQGKHVLGIDEAGYGCLAGSMYIAGVLYGLGFAPTGSLATINDSKKMSERSRNNAELDILTNCKLSFVIEVSVSDINEGNAYWLRFSKAKEWILKNSSLIPPDTTIVYDGDRSLDGIGFVSEALVKGDSKSFSIASASVLAKVRKDREMVGLHEQFPQYNWKSNKGYGTLDHIGAIQRFGTTTHHRTKYCEKILGEK